ncbi:hypothetical protein ACLKA7_007636 [Drosophila subpalustris]
MLQIARATAKANIATSHDVNARKYNLRGLVADAVAQRTGLSWTCESCREVESEMRAFMRQTRSGFKDLSVGFNKLNAQFLAVDAQFNSLKLLAESPMRKKSTPRDLQTTAISQFSTVEQFQTPTTPSAPETMFATPIASMDVDIPIVDAVPTDTASSAPLSDSSAVVKKRTSRPKPNIAPPPVIVTAGSPPYRDKRFCSGGPTPHYLWDHTMDTNKQNNKPKEAEQPPQSEVADLSTTVEPMDAEDGLDLDPYSPVSNSNTEEMEELLRVERQSPPKWCCSEAINTLPGQAEKLKRESSAPEISLPKQGSAKPGAGATPSRVPEIEAGSTDRKAAQPPIPRPTEMTGTREHRSYCEVASCSSSSLAPSSNTPEEQKEKTAGSTLEGPSTSAKAAKMERPATNAQQVARMRPPLYGRLPTKPWKGARRSQEKTVLLGSNRAFLQEPWILSGKIKGLNTREGNFLYAYEQQRPRAALLLNKKMSFVPLSQFITEDLVAVWTKVPTAGGEQEAVLASAYFPGDSSDAPPREVSAIVEYCQEKRIRWIIGYDANAHHIVWGSTDVNKREKKACLGALRLQGVANLKSGDLTGHLKILEIFFSSPIVHLSNSWRNSNLCTPSGVQVWYTDGSKLEYGDTGAGLRGPRFCRSIGMGKTPSIFQAEIHAIEMCTTECIRRRIQGATIFIISDSQAALKALQSFKITSKLVDNCLRILDCLGETNTLIVGGSLGMRIIKAMRS